MRTATQERAAYTWLSTRDVARQMGCSRQKVVNMIRAGAFGDDGVTRWGREYRIRPEALEAYLERNLVRVHAAA